MLPHQVTKASNFQLMHKKKKKTAVDLSIKSPILGCLFLNFGCSTVKIYKTKHIQHRHTLVCLLRAGSQGLQRIKKKASPTRTASLQNPSSQVLHTNSQLAESYIHVYFIK